MAQTTSSVVIGSSGAVSFATNGSTWNDISGIATAIEVSGGELETTDTYTMGTTTSIVTVGNLGALDVTVRTLYSELAGDFWSTLEGLYTAKTALKVRYAPKSWTTGNIGFTSTTGYISSFGYPSGEASAAEPIITEIVFRVPSLTKATI